MHYVASCLQAFGQGEKGTYVAVAAPRENAYPHQLVRLPDEVAGAPAFHHSFAKMAL
jgi:hypothetical protein